MLVVQVKPIRTLPHHVIRAARPRAPGPSHSITGAMRNFTAAAAVLLPAGSLSTSHMLGQLTTRAVSMSETHNTPCTLNRPCICIYYMENILLTTSSQYTVCAADADPHVCLLVVLAQLVVQRLKLAEERTDVP